MKKYLPYSWYAAKASLRAEVAGSYLNWLWWVINPLAMMLVYSFIFGVVFDAREEYFPAFLFIGLTLWDHFSRGINNSVKIVKKRKGVITKVYLPKYVLILSELFASVIKMLFSFGVIVVMLFVLRVPVTWNVLWIIPLVIVETIFTFGLACFVMHFGVFVEDLSNIIKIVMRFVYYGTGIFWNVETRLANYPKAQFFMMHWNPVGFFVVNGRRCLLQATHPDLIWLLFWLVASLVLSGFGILLVYRCENSYIKAI